MTETSFFTLDPEAVLQATENAGFAPTGEFTQLNSYENRVFDIRLERNSYIPNQTDVAHDRLIAKFYRPGRWSRDCILEEHDFLSDLAREKIPVAPPIVQNSGSTLLEHNGLYVAFFSKYSGRMPDEILEHDYKAIGRLIAQVHNVGAQKEFSHRPQLGFAPWTPIDNLDFLKSWVAPEMWPRYEDAGMQIVEKLDEHLIEAPYLRIHGDLHRGNLLLNPRQDSSFLLVDFDDSMMGPAVQDFWMLLQNFTIEERGLIVTGYEELREFPSEQWSLVPWLRGLRILSYSAWIARRWLDPSFPRLFPQFQSYSFWAEETEALEKIAWARD